MSPMSLRSVNRLRISKLIIKMIMNKVLAFLFASLVSAVCLVDVSVAQVQKNQKFRNAQGEVVETPYVSRSELRNIRLHGPKRTVRLGEITTVASVDEITTLLGAPDSTEIVDINAGSYERSIRLVYEGMTVKYIDAAGEIQLEDLQVYSSSHYIEIGKERLRPGMNSEQTSKSIRKTKSSDEGSQTHSHMIRVTEKEKASKKESIGISKKEGIVIEVDKSNRRVTKVRYYTTI